MAQAAVLTEAQVGLGGLLTAQVAAKAKAVSASWTPPSPAEVVTRVLALPVVELAASVAVAVASGAPRGLRAAAAAIPVGGLVALRPLPLAVGLLSTEAQITHR